MGKKGIMRGKQQGGFSLLELSVVMAILSIVAIFGLSAAADFAKRSAGDLTKDNLAQIDAALVEYFRLYGRLPCPSVRTLNPAPPSNYGLEDCSITVYTDTDTVLGIDGGGVMGGAVPFR